MQGCVDPGAAQDERHDGVWQLPRHFLSGAIPQGTWYISSWLPPDCTRTANERAYLQEEQSDFRPNRPPADIQFVVRRFTSLSARSQPRQTSLSGRSQLRHIPASSTSRKPATPSTGNYCGRCSSDSKCLQRCLRQPARFYDGMRARVVRMGDGTWYGWFDGG